MEIMWRLCGGKAARNRVTNSVTIASDGGRHQRTRAILRFVAYHATFWLAVSATAPVIALAATVSMNDVLKLLDTNNEAHDPPSSELPPGRQPVLWSMLLCTANLLIQLVILWTALDSIANGIDKAEGTEVVVWFEPAGIVLLLAVAWINAYARKKLGRLEPQKTKSPAYSPFSTCRLRRLHVNAGLTPSLT